MEGECGCYFIIIASDSLSAILHLIYSTHFTFGLILLFYFRFKYGDPLFFTA